MCAKRLTGENKKKNQRVLVFTVVARVAMVFRVVPEHLLGGPSALLFWGKEKRKKERKKDRKEKKNK